MAHPAGRSTEPFIFDDQIPHDLPIPDLTENARIVLEKRYLKKDGEGNPTEAPEVMFWRVAYTIAKEDVNLTLERPARLLAA